jgi:RHS repeat-associated protein
VVLRIRLPRASDVHSGSRYRYHASTYDLAGDLVTTTDAIGQLVTYTYDTLGRRTGTYSGTTSGTKLAAWSYDTATNGKGMLASRTTYVGGTGGVAYTESVPSYTNRGQPTGSSITFPTTVPASLQPLVGTYSASATYGAMSGLLATATFGADGGLPAETVNYSHNQNGILTNFGGVTGYLNNTQVDPFGRITRWTMGPMPNQVVQTNHYDEATGRVSEQFLDKESAATHVDDVTSLFNAAGQVTATTDVQDGTATDRQCYRYNQLDQMTDAWSDTGGVVVTPSPAITNIGHCVDTTPASSTVGGPGAYWQTYHYNSAGDRDTETDHDPSGVTANDVASTYNYSAVGTQPDLLRNQAHTGPGAGTDGYGYDLAGQTTTRSIAGAVNQTITYTPLRQTATISDTAGNSSAYVYDPDGQLLLQTSTRSGVTTTTLYLGSEQLTLNTTTNVVTGLRYYPTDGGPTVVRSSAGTVAYEAGNSQGTGLVVIDSGSAQTQVRRMVTPFGAARGTAPPSWVDNHGFLDRPTEPAAGLDLLGARVYDPTTGRFLQRDPVFEAGDINQLGGYTYGAANPVAHPDPSGLRACVDECSSLGGAGAHQDQDQGAVAGFSAPGGGPSEAVRKNVRHQLAQLVAYFMVLARVTAMGGDPAKVTMEFSIPNASKKKGSTQNGNADIIYTAPNGTVYIWEVKSAGEGGVDSAAASRQANSEVIAYIQAYRVSHPGVSVQPGFRIGTASSVSLMGEDITTYDGSLPGAILYSYEPSRPPTAPPPPPVPVTEPQKVPQTLPTPAPPGVPAQQPAQQPVKVPNPQPLPPALPTCMQTCVMTVTLTGVVVALVVFLLESGVEFA